MVYGTALRYKQCQAFHQSWREIPFNFFKLFQNSENDKNRYCMSSCCPISVLALAPVTKLSQKQESVTTGVFRPYRIMVNLVWIYKISKLTNFILKSVIRLVREIYNPMRFQAYCKR